MHRRWWISNTCRIFSQEFSSVNVNRSHFCKMSAACRCRKITQFHDFFVVVLFRYQMVTKREQMRIAAIHTMSMCSLVSDGSVPKIALAKSIFTKKMAMSRAGHCQMYLNLFKILEVLTLPLQNLVSKILVKSLQAVQVFRLALKWSMMSLICFFFFSQNQNGIAWTTKTSLARFNSRLQDWQRQHFRDKARSTP